MDMDGVDLMGYIIWGCIDVVLAGTGEMCKRYGKGTLTRLRKKFLKCIDILFHAAESLNDYEKGNIYNFNKI